MKNIFTSYCTDDYKNKFSYKPSVWPLFICFFRLVIHPLFKLKPPKKMYFIITVFQNQFRKISILSGISTNNIGFNNNSDTFYCDFSIKNVQLKN